MGLLGALELEVHPVRHQVEPGLPASSFQLTISSNGRVTLAFDL
jgi:hypothetical protein